MTSGRNGLCHCGSGRKYKKCCLLKDQVAEQERFSRSQSERRELPRADSARTAAIVSAPNQLPSQPKAASPPAPARPLDPRIKAINDRWGEFESLDNDDERRALFVRTLDEPELMDDEMAFEMLNNLYGSAVKSGERDQWADLVDQLRERLPDVYAIGHKYSLQWRIVNALAGSRSESLTALAREMAETAGDDVDQFVRVIDPLAYHGKLEVLAKASRIAWPLIRDSSDILWGQSDFARWGADCTLFERLEQSRELDGHDPELIEQIRFFFEDLQLDQFAEYVSYLGGQANRTWSLSDFQKPPKGRPAKTRMQDSDDEESGDKQSTPDDEGAALTWLLDEFVDYARHQEGVPYTKAALARDNISLYIRDREAGKLEPRQSMLAEMMNPQRKPRLKPRIPDHPLCTDRETLDRYFAGLLRFMNPQHYDVAATFELIPAWLGFLESRRLIESGQRETTLAELRDLQATLLKLWESDRTDPALADNLLRWNESAEKP